MHAIHKILDVIHMMHNKILGDTHYMNVWPSPPPKSHHNRAEGWGLWEAACDNDTPGTTISFSIQYPSCSGLPSFEKNSFGSGGWAG